MYNDTALGKGAQDSPLLSRYARVSVRIYEFYLRLSRFVRRPVFFVLYLLELTLLVIPALDNNCAMVGPIIASCGSPQQKS